MTLQQLDLSQAWRPNSTVVIAVGSLDLTGYPTLRDHLLKVASDEPNGLIADISGLDILDPALVSVFTLVATRIGNFPAIPFAVISNQDGHRALLRNPTVDRFVAVYADAATAEANFDRPVRLRRQREIARSINAGARARSFVTEVCTEWQMPQLSDVACLIATELVENTLMHTDSTPRVRLDLRRGLCTIAVADDSPRAAYLHEGLRLAERGLGLKLVAQLSRVWGCSRTWSGGQGRLGGSRDKREATVTSRGE